MVWSSVTTPLPGKKHVTIEVVIFLSSRLQLRSEALTGVWGASLAQKSPGIFLISRRKRKKDQFQLFSLMPALIKWIALTSHFWQPLCCALFRRWRRCQLHINTSTTSSFTGERGGRCQRGDELSEARWRSACFSLATSRHFITETFGGGKIWP